MALEDQDPQGGSPEAAPVADPTPAPGTTIDWDVDDNPWKTRFETYRTEADRRNTQLSQYEQALEDFRSGDPDQMRRAAHILNVADSLEIPEPEPEYDPDDPVAAMQAQMQAQIDELSGKLTEREQRDMDRDIENQLSKLDGLDPDDHDLVLAQAIRMSENVHELPSKIQGAYEALRARDQARIDAEMRKWADGKKPTSIAPGTTGSPAEDIMQMDKAALDKRDREAIERAALRHLES